MDLYCESLTTYKRLRTREVQIGDLLLGNPDVGDGHPIRVQTMTTTDTMDTLATVEQSIRCIEAGSELIRITAPSKREAENLLHIKNELRRRGYKTPIVADIHFTPNAAEIAARIVEKVRVNPGNYVDKKKFESIEYTDAQYREEIDRIHQRFVPLIKICKEYGTAMRIGTNHGSLSDRIMSRYGDTPIGMVESAMEFLRIARSENYHQIVLSMYYLVYGLLYIISLLPLRVLYVVSDFVYVVLYYLVGYRRKVVFANLKRAFPEKSQEELKAIAKRFYKNFTDNFIEFIKLISASPEFIARHFYGDCSLLDSLYQEGKRAQIQLAHNFNWEGACVAIAARTKQPFIVVYMPIGNKVVDKIFLKVRSRTGAILLPATDMFL